MSLKMPKRKPSSNGSGRTPSLSAHALASEAVEKSGEVVDLLERAFELVSEDDPVQPTTHHIYAALREAETRRKTLEDWRARTYGEIGEEAENGNLENGNLS